VCVCVCVCVCADHLFWKGFTEEQGDWEEQGRWRPVQGCVGALLPGASWTQFLSSPGVIGLRLEHGMPFTVHAEFLLPCPHAWIGFPVGYTASPSYPSPHPQFVSFFHFNTYEHSICTIFTLPYPFPTSVPLPLVSIPPGRTCSAPPFSDFAFTLTLFLKFYSWWSLIIQKLIFLFNFFYLRGNIFIILISQSSF
jgi:hypothetical protein